MKLIKYILFIFLFSFGFNFFGYSKPIESVVVKEYPEHFMTVMKSVLLFEGGFSDILDDPGGATNFGVTQETYDTYRTKKKLDIQTVKLITNEEVYDCYYRYYYLPAGCDTLPPAVSFVHFDASVNFGTLGSKKLLLKAFNNIQTGDLTTLDKQLALKYVDVRKEKRYQIVTGNEKKRKFLKGWLNRDIKVQKIIETYYT
jgi:lysozyme family protein